MNQETTPNDDVYPWSLIAGKTVSKEPMVPVSRLQHIIEIGEGIRIDAGDTYALDCVLQKLKEHTNPDWHGSQ